MLNNISELNTLRQRLNIARNNCIFWNGICENEWHKWYKRVIELENEIENFSVKEEHMSKFKVRLFYDIDKKNYHLNPLSIRRGHYTKVTANEFLTLVELGRLSTR